MYNIINNICDMYNKVVQIRLILKVVGHPEVVDTFYYTIFSEQTSFIAIKF